VVAQAAGGQAEGIARVAGLGQGDEGRVEEAGAAVFGGELAVLVEPLSAGGLAFGQRPLLRAALATS
jgi:hypothetical protein